MQMPPPDAFDVSKFGTLHDLQYDHSGQRLATATADCIVRVWSVDRREIIAELRGHKAPVTTLSWAGGSSTPTTIASGDSSGSVIIWRELKPGEWQVVHSCSVRTSANVVAFGPAEYGLVLVVAAGGGEITWLFRREIRTSPMLPPMDQWSSKTFCAHNGSVVAMSWAPSTSPATLAAGPAAKATAAFGPRRLVTAGTDNKLRTWRFDEQRDTWELVQDLSDGRHTGAVRDVAWRPNLGIPASNVASCTQDGCVGIWVQDVDGQPWRLQSCWNVASDARRLSWSNAGILLAVSAGESRGVLYKEDNVGDWGEVSAFDD